jgi:hypothetical protein
MGNQNQTNFKANFSVSHDDNRESPRSNRSRNENEIKELMVSIKEESFDDNKIEILKKFGGGLKAKEAKELVKMMTFADGQKEACVVLYPKLCDADNVEIMFEGCTFFSSRDEAKNELGLS